jgi:hypothetical protein
MNIYIWYIVIAILAWVGISLLSSFNRKDEYGNINEIETYKHNTFIYGIASGLFIGFIITIGYFYLGGV